MRITLFLILALIAGTASAQQPVIDSMLIDESKGILSVYGDFGTAQGKVWCDSVELPVLTWSDTLVTATIPDSGKGSAGGVVVDNINGTSEIRYLTLWTSHVEFESRHGSGSREDHTKADFFLYWRYDIHSILKSVNKYRLLSFTGMSVSRDSQLSTYSVFDTLKTYDSISHKPLIYTVYFDIEKMEIDAYINLQVSTFWGTFTRPGFLLDTNLSISNFIKDESQPSAFYYTRWGLTNPVAPPPSKAIALKNNPSIIAPKDKRTNLGTNDILLQWDTLKHMDSYHIQLSKDSLINSQQSSQQQQAFTYIVDTIVSSLDFQLPHLEKSTKYYWRVCGVNTEGESRWSDVWSFTTGTSADVRTEKEDISFSCYPNPASSQMTITSPSPSSFTISNTAGQEIRKGLLQAGQTKIDVSALPSGVYFVRVAGEKQAKMIQILH